MASHRDSWATVVSRVGGASLDLLGAELRALEGELAETGRRLARLAAIAGLAFGLSFWGLGVALTAAVAGVATRLPLWLAALVVALVLFLAGGMLLLWARSRLRAIESPVVTVRRRVEDHVGWWQSEVKDSASPDGARAASTSGTGEAQPATAPASEGPLP